MVLSVWMMVIVSSERYFALSRPLAHRIFDTERRAVALCLIAVLFAGAKLVHKCSTCHFIAVLFTVPTYWEVFVFSCVYTAEYDARQLFSIVWATELRK